MRFITILLIVNEASGEAEAGLFYTAGRHICVCGGARCGRVYRVQMTFLVRRPGLERCQVFTRICPLFGSFDVFEN